MYPSIYIIGKELSRTDFLKQRLSAAGWVHNSEFVRKILRGEYDKIFPLHIELCVTYQCNFNCSWCSCRKSRMTKGIDTSLSYSELCTIIDECATHSTGIQWTGGEPLINVNTLSAIEYASMKGVRQCLFTNGSFLDVSASKRLLNTNLAFVRISLNSAGVLFHTKFHGNIDQRISMRVLSNLDRFAYLKSTMKSDVQLGVSLVLDRNNILDFHNTLLFLLQTKEKYPNGIDYIIIRPVNDDIGGEIGDKNKEFFVSYNSELAGNAIEELRQLGVQIVTPNEIELPYMHNEKCYGCSFFSEVSPDGSMSMCSDSYGDDNYVIGNILEECMDDIWKSSSRYETLEKNANCFSNHLCPQYSRGWSFNVVLGQIETFRKRGQMERVLKWIAELKKSVPYVQHSFFI